MKITINYFQLIDTLNIRIGAYYPVNYFLSKKEILRIANFKNYKKNKFFPFPIFFSISNYQKKKISGKKKISLFFKNYKICELKIINFFRIDKVAIGQKIFNTKDKNHPGFKAFLDTENNFIHGKIVNFNNKILNKFKVKNCESIRKKIKIKNIKSIVGFHTRNAPHKSHEWIHKYGITKCKNILLNPMVFQYKKGEFKESIIRKTYKKLVEIKKNNNVLLEFNFNYPRYAGPREALFHAVTRKNFGCTHFLVGRDHAGVKQYYKKYASQKLSKKFEKKIGIKIITFKEPYFCSSSKTYSNVYKESFCQKSKRIFISGKNIRKKIFKNQTIPEFMMRKEISKLLSKNSLIS